MPSSVPVQHHRQCIHAAYSSRLDPYALHPGEIQLFKTPLDDHHVKLYLSLRNSILRLWTRNPLVSVLREEAAGCSRDRRYQRLALVAWEWLSKNGYINFGCLDHPSSTKYQSVPQSWPQKTVVIIGAGVAGLACARQLYGLFHQFSDQWGRRGERLPRIIILEGRNRVGGRIYSHPLRHQDRTSLPHSLANVAELGAQIVTGFDNGNPLDAVIRGQLALEYHLMTDNMTLYDHDGTIVNDVQDRRMEELFNEIQEAASEHPLNWKPAVKVSTPNGLRTTLAPANEDAQPQKPSLFPGLANGIQPKMSTNGDLQPPSLGTLMNELVAKFQRERNLSAQDLRILNWHFAHLEYGNAINVSDMSLGGWDQDSGNEFDGQHSMILGGYNQLIRGLLQEPFMMDVRLNHSVQNIGYTSEEVSDHGNPTKGQIDCGSGRIIDADQIVLTAPLGVLKSHDMLFKPDLPSWKQDTIHRLGFGVLNKIVLVFPECFWPPDRDMFGLCNQPPFATDSLHQSHYSRNRGRFFLFFNALKSSGRPVLVALMAGDSAFDTESCGPSSPYRTPTSLQDTKPWSSFGTRSTSSSASTPMSSTPPPDSSEALLIASCTEKLATMFRLSDPPKPLEAIITRWRSDPFSRGSYSYLGTDARPGDYENMAKRCGNLHFAGEATCGTHPATVHGAFISGLRAAADVVEQLAGSIDATGSVPS